MSASVVLFIFSQSTCAVAATQLPSAFWRASSPLVVRLYLARVGSSGGDDSDTLLPLGVDDNEELPLDLSVETNPIFTVGVPFIGFSETCGVREGLGCEPKVEPTVLECLLAFVVIPLKLQMRKGTGT